MNGYCTEWYDFFQKRIFKTRGFTRRMRKTGVINDVLRKAVSEMAQGLIDADLGGYVVKKRVALPGQVKRGGVRTIVATKLSDRQLAIALAAAEIQEVSYDIDQV